MKTETFKAAHSRILASLAALGWDTVPHLKVRHATSPDGAVRIWFKAQALYVSAGPRHSLNVARSIHSDGRGRAISDVIHDAHYFAADDAGRREQDALTGEP
jgi:hypothetical protein